MQLLETVFGETAASLTESGIINFVSDHYTIRTTAGVLATGAAPFPFHFVDRTRFDACLRNHAERAGATIFENTQIVQSDPLNGVVTTKDGKTLQGKILIGADGANSIVRKEFPHNRDRFRQFMAPTIEVRLPLNHFPRAVKHPELVLGIVDAGYGWVFPNQDSVVVGICGLNSKKHNFSRLFRKYIDFLEIDPVHHPPFHGHPLPYGNYLQDPTHGCAILAGDAAGLVEPLFGEGIFFALCSGHEAALASDHALHLRTAPGPFYASRLHHHILPEIMASDTLRWSLFKAMKHLGPKSIGMFINSVPTPLAEMVHGIRSYSWLKRKKWDFSINQELCHNSKRPLKKCETGLTE
jgi:flavin-dependent dehydrogenase